MKDSELEDGRRVNDLEVRRKLTWMIWWKENDFEEGRRLTGG